MKPQFRCSVGSAKCGTGKMIGWMEISLSHFHQATPRFVKDLLDGCIAMISVAPTNQSRGTSCKKGCSAYVIFAEAWELLLQSIYSTKDWNAHECTAVTIARLPRKRILCCAHQKCQLGLHVDWLQVLSTIVKSACTVLAKAREDQFPRIYQWSWLA